MGDVLSKIGDGLSNSFLMAWEVWWALVFGFAISAIVQAWVPRDRIQRALGGSGPRPVALAEFVGGLVLITIMTVLLRLFVSQRLEEQAREHAQKADTGHLHHAAGA